MSGVDQHHPDGDGAEETRSAAEQVPEELEDNIIDQDEEAPGAGGPPENHELAALNQELQDAKAREAEYLDGWQRARAELANARKRFERDQRTAYSNAQSDLLIQLLPIVDDFERALGTLPDDAPDRNWCEGILLIQRNLQTLLERAGVAATEAEGHEFDPFAHQAVTHEPSDSVPEGQVIAVLQKGYKQGDRVLRPAMVRVSSGRPPEPGEPSDPSV